MTDNGKPPALQVVEDYETDLRMVWLRPGSAQENPDQWRTHPALQLDALQELIFGPEGVGWAGVALINDRRVQDGWPEDRAVPTHIDGHARERLATNNAQPYPALVGHWTPDQEATIMATFDPLTTMAGTDYEKQLALLQRVPVGMANVDEVLNRLTMEAEDALAQLLAAQEGEGTSVARTTLAERFVVPPFSVLDARQGYWQDRKRAWLALGLRGELGRSEDTGDADQGAAYGRAQAGLNALTGASMPATSVFDPVLAELVCRWFAPPGGRVLDPFAGEATKGIVAAYLGLDYTGVELRQEQVDANVVQAATILGQPAPGIDRPGGGPQLRLTAAADNALTDEAVDLHSATSGLPLRPAWKVMARTLQPMVQRLYDATGTELVVGNVVDTVPLADAIDDGTLWVSFSGGKDSTAAALLAYEAGFKPVLYHVQGFNRAHTGDIKYVRQLASAMNMPLLIDRVHITGAAAGFIEAPFENQVIAMLMAARMAECGGAHWTSGMMDVDAADDMLLGLNFTDSTEVGVLFAAHLAARLPGLQYHTFVERQAHALAIVNRYGLLNHVHGCLSPSRFQGTWHDKNYAKFGDAVLPGRCGSCFKCWSEWLILVALGIMPDNEDYRAHARAGFKRVASQQELVEWHGDAEAYYLQPHKIDPYKPPAEEQGDTLPRGTQAIPAKIRAIDSQPPAAIPATTATWLTGDSAQLDQLLPEGQLFDMVFTSPPYYDLEIYSEGQTDGSALGTYAEFIEWYDGIMAACAARLADNRFLVVKVGDIRDSQGAYRGFVADAIASAQRAGLQLYNEAIFITPAGSLPIRTAAQFPKGRKLGKTHQNLLVFYKGDARQVGQHFTEFIEHGDPTITTTEEN